MVHRRSCCMLFAGLLAAAGCAVLILPGPADAQQPFSKRDFNDLARQIAEMNRTLAKIEAALGTKPGASRVRTLERALDPNHAEPWDVGPLSGWSFTVPFVSLPGYSVDSPPRVRLRDVLHSPRGQVLNVDVLAEVIPGERAMRVIIASHQNETARQLDLVVQRAKDGGGLVGCAEIVVTERRGYE